MFIDTHCHISKNDSNFNEVLEQMKDNIMIISGCDPISNKEVVELTKEYSNIYGVIGIHPDEVDNINKEDIEFLKENIKNSKIVGIGEIGLDYYHNNENKEKQKNLFLKQIDIALSNNKPIVIHSREAIQDTIDILKEKNITNAVMHCYGGSIETAKELVKQGIRLGIGGVVTFKNGLRLKEVVKAIPLEYLLLETDSPYLSPEPFRGQVNVPYNCYYVAKVIAELKGISLDQVLLKTTENACIQFDLKL